MGKQSEKCNTSQSFHKSGKGNISFKPLVTSLSQIHQDIQRKLGLPC